MKNPNPNLELHGDLDDVELLEAVEQEFDIKFSDDEAEAAKTVGEFYDASATKMELKGRTLGWAEFTKILEPHGSLSAQEMTRQTEFFREI